MTRRLALCLLVVGVLGATSGAPAPSEQDPLRKLAPAVASVAHECLAKKHGALACWKLFLVRRVDGFLGDIRESERVKHSAPFELLPGLVALEKDARRQDNEVFEDGVEAKDDGQDADQLDPGRDQESLDRALIARTSKLFAGRHVTVKLFPGVALVVSPKMAEDQNSIDTEVSVDIGDVNMGRAKMKNLSPVFLLPPLMFMGMMPFLLATIKGVVVKAMMLNQLAFLSTLWMTVREVVFGPRPIIKYHNYGYKPTHPPVHFRHPAPPAHLEHHQAHLEHHHEPVHFEHHHEEHHLPDHRVEHHVEHHETHGHSPFFHDESGSAEDYAQDLSYVGADDRNDRGHPSKHADQGDQGLQGDEEEGVPLPQASPYRRHPAVASVAASSMYGARPERPDARPSQGPGRVRYAP